MGCSMSIYFTCAREKMVLGQGCAGAVPFAISTLALAAGARAAVK